MNKKLKQKSIASARQIIILLVFSTVVMAAFLALNTFSKDDIDNQTELNDSDVVDYNLSSNISDYYNNKTKTCVDPDSIRNEDLKQCIP